MAVSAPPSTQLPRRSPILLIAVIIGLILLAGCGQATTTQDTPGEVAPADPRAAVAVAPADPRVAVAAWWDGGGQDRLSAMSKDATDIVAAGTAYDVTGISAACASLQTHVEAAQAYASVPDTMIQTDWSTALAQYARSATDCVAATRNRSLDNLDGDLLTQSAREAEAGTTALGKCTDRLNALRG
jgi:ABC-type glycerol-3-phosphate transport system substrate-binding protein